MEGGQNKSANVLFKGRDYCRLVAPSHFGLTDNEFEERVEEWVR